MKPPTGISSSRMKKLGMIAAVVVALIGGLVLAYNLAYPTYSHRYRLTIEVETPDGLKTGSSVIESRLRTEPPILPNTGAVTSLHGDAVFVDLGNGKNVVGLLALGDPAQYVDGPVRLAINAFGIPNCGKPFCQWKQIAETTGARDLPLNLVPTLVSFGAVSDPKTARVVRPQELEDVFGPGYHFKRAWIEMTNDPITRSITKHLQFYDARAAGDDFWKALLASGFKPGSAIEPYTLLRRGS